ncbi:retromer complex subunit Vps35 [Kalmusia sp. IMI 367209]|nr:retromer complex subunit Vps35 [Kalmusia sp. IMI 367209]
MDAAVSVELFVKILNRYVYYFDQENEPRTLDYIASREYEGVVTTLKQRDTAIRTRSAWRFL